MILIIGGMGFIGIRTARALAPQDIMLGYHGSVRAVDELRSLIGPCRRPMSRSPTAARSHRVGRVSLASSPCPACGGRGSGAGGVLPDQLRHTGTRENANCCMDISRAR